MENTVRHPVIPADLLPEFIRGREDTPLSVFLHCYVPEFDCFEKFGWATVDLLESVTLPEDTAFIDDRTLPGLYERLASMGWTEETPLTATLDGHTYRALRFHYFPR